MTKEIIFNQIDYMSISNDDTILILHLVPKLSRNFAIIHKNVSFIAACISASNLVDRDSNQQIVTSRKISIIAFNKDFEILSDIIDCLNYGRYQQTFNDFLNTKLKACLGNKLSFKYKYTPVAYKKYSINDTLPIIYTSSDMIITQDEIYLLNYNKGKFEVKIVLDIPKLKKVMMHCFCGRRHLVKKIIDNGWFLTAPTSIVRSTQFQENIELCPITQLFCETDAPYLSPYKSNDSGFNRTEPAFIIESYKKIAEIKNMELNEVVNNIWMNWQKVFG
jgi:hypothetical protein